MLFQYELLFCIQELDDSDTHTVVKVILLRREFNEGSLGRDINEDSLGRDTNEGSLRGEKLMRFIWERYL